MTLQVERLLCVGAGFLFGKPLAFANVPARRDPAAFPVVEEYQIAFLCDNFFLPGVTSEITLANVPIRKRDETPISLED